QSFQRGEIVELDSLAAEGRIREEGSAVGVEFGQSRDIAHMRQLRIVAEFRHASGQFDLFGQNCTIYGCDTGHGDNRIGRVDYSREIGDAVEVYRSRSTVPDLQIRRAAVCVTLLNVEILQGNGVLCASVREKNPHGSGMPLIGNDGGKAEVG